MRAVVGGVYVYVYVCVHATEWDIHLFLSLARYVVGIGISGLPILASHTGCRSMNPMQFETEPKTMRKRAPCNEDEVKSRETTGANGQKRAGTRDIAHCVCACICVRIKHMSQALFQATVKTLQVVNIATISSVRPHMDIDFLVKLLLIHKHTKYTPCAPAMPLVSVPNSKCYIERPQMICVLPSRLSLSPLEIYSLVCVCWQCGCSCCLSLSHSLVFYSLFFQIITVIQLIKVTAQPNVLGWIYISFGMCVCVRVWVPFNVPGN